MVDAVFWLWSGFFIEGGFLAGERFFHPQRSFFIESKVFSLVGVFLFFYPPESFDHPSASSKSSTILPPLPTSTVTFFLSGDPPTLPLSYSLTYPLIPP